MIQEGTITHTLIMTFKDAKGSVRSLKVPQARPDVTRKEVRQVMELIIRIGCCLSHKGLPLLKIVRATLVTVRWIFVAAKKVSTPQSKNEVNTKSRNQPTPLLSFHPATQISHTERGNGYTGTKPGVQDNQFFIPYRQARIHTYHGKSLSQYDTSGTAKSQHQKCIDEFKVSPAFNKEPFLLRRYKLRLPLTAPILSP